MATCHWEPPAEVSRDEIVGTSNAVLGRPDIPIRIREEVFRIRVLGFDWDIGGDVFEPDDPARIPLGADGKRAGIFLLHGGGGDHRTQRPLGRLLARKFGFKVATMTYPGHLYLLDPSRDWPGDTLREDGSARTPVFTTAGDVPRDQYDIVQDRHDPVLRAKYGTFHFVRAKEGTEFYYRMAAWPMAFEEAMKAVCARAFPPGEFSVYLHGHSTGGPYVHMLLQRLANAAGLVGAESTPFGSLMSRMQKQGWPFPFNYMMVRTWRDVARYAGPEAGPEGIKRLPWLMEDVFAEWERRKHLPGIKAQHIVQYAAYDALEQAARVSAQRLGMGAAETEELVRRFRSYPQPLSGPDVRPVPPLLYSLARGSRDHTPEKYSGVLLPALAALQPPPKVRVTLFQAGVHSYMKPEPELPQGIGPAIAQLWYDAITRGYYLT